jgi:proline iminopeptidase
MDRTAAPRHTSEFLYPPIEPFDQRMIDVGEGHRIYVEQCGHPQGRPVLVLHGGPGGGCSPVMRRYFDPSHYRVILFDQRGCGRSRPHASTEANTTWHLVADIEAIRGLLGIDRWIVFGGSWGATLGLVYAISHPERVAHLVLRGVFLMTKGELDWFYGGGAGGFFPAEWARFIAPIPEAERADLIAAYHRRLFSGNVAEEVRHGRVWTAWENALASVAADGAVGDSPSDYARAFARLENHYFVNGGFLDHDGWIESRKHALAEVPATIVQGRYDMICPPVAAWRLAEGWARADLRMMGLSGHALSEPRISAELVRVMQALRDAS